MVKLIKYAAIAVIGDVIIRNRTGHSVFGSMRDALVQLIDGAEDRRLGRKFGYRKKIVIKVYRR